LKKNKIINSEELKFLSDILQKKRTLDRRGFFSEPKNISHAIRSKPNQDERSLKEVINVFHDGLA
jgi:hypothetical protein